MIIPVQLDKDDGFSSVVATRKLALGICGSMSDIDKDNLLLVHWIV